MSGFATATKCCRFHRRGACGDDKKCPSWRWKAMRDGWGTWNGSLSGQLTRRDWNPCNVFPAPENDRQRYLGVLTHLFTHLLPKGTRITTWLCFVLHLQDDTQCVSSRNVIFYTLLLCAPVTRSRVPSQSPTVHASGIVFDASFGLNFQISAALGLIAGYGYRMSFAAQLTLSMLKLGLPVAVETNAERADNLQTFCSYQGPFHFWSGFSSINCD